MSDYTDRVGYVTPRNVKISEFITTLSGSVGADAKFTYIQDGQNFSITLSELLIVLGSIGSLESLGEVTGIPLLHSVGVTHYIRTLLGGSGTVANLTPEGGVKVDLNLESGTSGIPILTGVGSTLPVIRSLIAGAGVSIASSGNVIQISVSEIPTASNVVIINEMADFPEAEVGVRTLADHTAYLVSADLITSDRFIAGENSVVYGADTAVASLTYTGVDTFFTSTVDNFKLTLLALSATNGKLFDVSTVSSTGVYQLINITVESCKYLGSISNMRAVQITDIFCSEITTEGIDFSGDIGIVLGDRNVFNISNGSVFGLGTAIIRSGFSFALTYANLAAGSFFLSGLPDSGNLDTGTLGSLSSCSFKGSGTVLDGISEKDALWEFSNNNGFPDSINSLLAVHGASTLTISAPNTPVKIEDTWVCSHKSRLECSVDGRFTYIGKGSHLNISVTVTADIVSGVDICTFYIYKNGVQEASSAVVREFDSGNPGNLSMIWQIDLETDEYFELFAENNDTSVNILIVNAIIGVS